MREMRKIENVDGILNDYKVVLQLSSLPEQKYLEHLKLMIDHFKGNLEMIDLYIECSKSHIINRQQFQHLFYRLDEEFYLLF